MDESSSLSESYDYLFKFLVIGSAGTGKSCILHQFIEGRFKPDSSHTSTYYVVQINLPYNQVSEAWAWHTASNPSIIIFWFWDFCSGGFYRLTILVFLKQSDIENKVGQGWQKKPQLGIFCRCLSMYSFLKYCK